MTHFKRLVGGFFTTACFAVSFLACSTPPVQNGRSSGLKEPSPPVAPPAPAIARPAAGEALIRFEFKPGELAKLCDESMARATRRLDGIAKLAPARRNFAGTMGSMERTLADLGDEITPLTFMAYVSTSEAIHKEGEECEEKSNRFSVEVMSRKDLYQAVKDQAPGDDADRRLLQETLKAFEKNGLKLPDEKLADVTRLKSELAQLESKFSANLNNDVSTVEFGAGELEGVPETVLARLKKNAAGHYIATTKETDYTQLMENMKREDSRRKMMIAFYNRAADRNVKLLEEAISLRQKIAGLLGFRTWADYRIKGRMAKDGATVLEFLNGLKGKLEKRNRQDLALLLKFKRELDPSARELKAWDLKYLEYQLKKRDFTLDKERIREYFPAAVVIQGLFDVYSKLLGVSFVEVRGAKVWAPDVKLYRIEDAGSHREIGHFYTDFFPRERKYGHAAAFQLISGRQLGNDYEKPVSAIVANLTPPSGDKPALLGHDEVETIFHEFGHVMHQTLTRAPFSSLSGANVAQDFVEAPSQMLENWVWSPEILASLSGHYKDTGKKLPPELLGKMIAARDFNKGYFYTRQLYLGLVDMTYHTTPGKVDTTAIQDSLHKSIVGLDPIPGGHFQASFGHLMGGYDSGYYGYLWSEVYAEDMFTAFEKNGLLDSATGMKYRKAILEKGDMREAIDLLREFLGREPNNDAFFRRLRIR